jgi:hypothetical protein
MQLATAWFGPVAFTLEEVLLLHGEAGRQGHRRWLPLADAHHPALFWLQSLDDGDQAFATLVATAASAGPRISLPRSVVEQLGISPQTPPIILIPLDLTPPGCRAVDGHRIVINPQRRIGRHLYRPPASNISPAHSLHSARTPKVA